MPPESDSRSPAQVLADVLSDIRILTESMPDSTEARVEAGSILVEIMSVTKEKLHSIKEELRKEADKLGESQAHFSTPYGSTATIKRPAPTVALKPESILRLRAALGDAFDEYIETTYKPRKGFSEKVASSNDHHRQPLLDSVDQIENTPRVSFRREG